MTTLLAAEQMAVNLTTWTFNDRFDSFTHWHPFSKGLYTQNSRACTNSNVKLNEPLALNPAINGRATRSIRFIAIYNHDILAAGMVKYDVIIVE